MKTKESVEAQRQREKAFFELLQRFCESQNGDEVQRLGEELGRFVFGE